MSDIMVTGFLCGVVGGAVALAVQRTLASVSRPKQCINCRWWEMHSNEQEGFCRTDPNIAKLSTIPVRNSKKYTGSATK